MSQPKWIVSANYRDRSSPDRWLVRPAGQSIESSVAVQSVKAKNVEFGKAYEEVGFGCSVVAVCESIETFPHILTFDRDRDLFVDETGAVRLSVDELILNKSGQVTAVA